MFRTEEGEGSDASGILAEDGAGIFPGDGFDDVLTPTSESLNRRIDAKSASEAAKAACRPSSRSRLVDAGTWPFKPASEVTLTGDGDMVI